MDRKYYASHSYWSEPGEYRGLLARLDAEPVALAKWIASLLQHPRSGETKARGFSTEQVGHLERRTVSEILSLAGPRNLIDSNVLRPKIGGVCRDFAIIAMSTFRERRIPARLRVGFADYLVKDHWEDHWLCEWWESEAWKRLDVEFAAAGVDVFNAADVPSERFLTAAEAWFRIREEPGTAPRFGVSALNLSGAWFIAGSLFRELAALLKLELKPWDYWGLARDLSRDPGDWKQGTIQTLDELAAKLKIAEEDPEAIQDWPLPARVLSFPYGEPLIVPLEDI